MRSFNILDISRSKLKTYTTIGIVALVAIFVAIFAGMIYKQNANAAKWQNELFPMGISAKWYGGPDDIEYIFDDDINAHVITNVSAYDVELSGTATEPVIFKNAYDGMIKLTLNNLTEKDVETGSTCITGTYGCVALWNSVETNFDVNLIGVNYIYALDNANDTGDLGNEINIVGDGVLNTHYMYGDFFATLNINADMNLDLHVDGYTPFSICFGGVVFGDTDVLIKGDNDILLENPAEPTYNIVYGQFVDIKNGANISISATNSELNDNDINVYLVNVTGGGILIIGDQVVTKINGDTVNNPTDTSNYRLTSGDSMTATFNSPRNNPNPPTPSPTPDGDLTPPNTGLFR